MSYARFSHADVYVFMNVNGYLDCCGCILGDQYAFHSTDAMIDHLAQHRDAGHDVPDGKHELYKVYDDKVDYKKAYTLAFVDKGRAAAAPVKKNK